MKKVLIAIDYNPTAQKVAEEGFSLAKSMNAHITLLHVVSDETYYANLNYSAIMGFYGTDFFNSINTDDLMKAAREYLDKTKEHLGDSTIETLAVQGDFAEVITDTAKKQGSDIIVMGSHSKRWLEKILMGSVTQSVLSHSTIPLFIIPTNEYKLKQTTDPSSIKTGPAIVKTEPAPAKAEPALMPIK